MAVTASGMAACETAGVSYRRLDSWCQPEEIAELGWRNYRVLDEFCAVADDALLGAIPDLARRKLTPLRFLFFFAKIAMDSLSIKVLTLSRMLETEKPARVVYAASSAGPGPENLPSFDHGSNLFAEILERTTCAAGIERRRLAAAAMSPPGRSWSARALLGSARRHAGSRIRSVRGRMRRERPYLLFNQGHDIPYVMPLLAARGFRPIAPARVDDALPARPIDWHRLLGADRLASVFSVNGHSYDALMLEHFFLPLAAQLPTAVASYDAVAAQLRSEPTTFALTGTINVNLADRSMMAAAQHAGVKLVTYQEGAGYGSMVTPIYDYTEARDGDLLLVYGEGNAEYYAELGWRTKPFRAVGSAHQDVVRHRLANATSTGRPFTVMYVGTNVDVNIMHCPNNGLVDTYYFRAQLRLFDALRDLPDDVRVIAKLHSADVASRELLSAPGYRRILVEDRQLEAVIDQADVFVIDFPSTTLLCACSTRASILVLAEPGVTGLTPAQEARLGRRARIFHGVDDLVLALHAEMAARAGEPTRDAPDVADDAYLLAYAIHRRDGRSAERAANALVEIAEESLVARGAQRAAQ